MHPAIIGTVRSLWTVDVAMRQIPRSTERISSYSNFLTLRVFEPPFGGGGLETTYDVHLGLIGKHVVDFLLALIELFFAMCYG